MITLNQYYSQHNSGLAIRTDIVSSCCSAPVENIEGSYNEKGLIYAGYSCTKCFKHLYDMNHFNERGE